MRYSALRYIVSHKALETIEWECRKYPDTETGGILVGYKDAGQVTVTHATGSGPKAERSAHHFTKDTPYLQSVLNLLGHYYQVDYLGVWHKHPQAMPFPSGGDILSAMEEVRDQDMMLEELLTPICLLDEGKVDILPFVIREDHFGGQDACVEDSFQAAEDVGLQPHNIHLTWLRIRGACVEERSLNRNLSIRGGDQE